MMTPRERAKQIVSTLYIPADPNRWDESPISVPELEEMIARAIEDGIKQAILALPPSPEDDYESD